MFLVVDTSTSNVTAEAVSYATAEQIRIQMIGANPELAEYIEVVDMGRELAAYDAARDADQVANPA